MHPALSISLALLPALVPASAADLNLKPNPNLELNRNPEPEPSSSPAAGEKLPKGPPWFTEYRHARRHALRTGTPVFVYFTKTV